MTGKIELVNLTRSDVSCTLNRPQVATGRLRRDGVMQPTKIAKGGSLDVGAHLRVNLDEAVKVVSTSADVSRLRKSAPPAIMVILTDPDGEKWRLAEDDMLEAWPPAPTRGEEPAPERPRTKFVVHPSILHRQLLEAGANPPPLPVPGHGERMTTREQAEAWGFQGDQAAVLEAQQRPTPGFKEVPNDVEDALDEDGEADGAPAVPEAQGRPSNAWTEEQVRAFAEEKGISLGRAKRKPAMLRKIRQAGW